MMLRYCISFGMAMAPDPRQRQFSFFLRRWGEELQTAGHIIHMLSQEREILDYLGVGELVDSRSIMAVQEEWVWLCSHFFHPAEHDFFKPWWIPVERDTYDVFLDMSDESFPLFRANYLFVEPMRWYQEPVVEEVSELLLARDVDYDLEALRKRNERITRNRVDALFREKVDMAFRGDLQVEPMTAEELGLDSGSECTLDQNFEVDFHALRGISPLVIGLLPYELPVNIRELGVHHGSQPERVTDIKCVRDLVFLIRHTGSSRVSSFFMETQGDIPGSFAYCNSELIISDKNQELVKDFFSRLAEIAPMEFC